MRVPLLAANWKMHKTAREARVLVEDLLKQVGAVSGREMALCPPFPYLSEVGRLLEGKSWAALGAQNVYWKDSGAFTGEVSPLMLKDCGCRYAIIGHSERRALFHEVDADCQKKVQAALAHGLVPILCVGETLEQREAGQTAQVVLGQLRGALQGASLDSGSKLVVAYEPVWAIGTGKTDTPEEANKTMALLRGDLAEQLGERVASQVRLLYGGSVKPNNIDGFMAQSDIDGALVGGASLEAESFARIVNFQVTEGVSQ
ncbi:MAG: triosephosphate isomerase [Candidatus Xenobia bacterium]|jgi:triosephosphate isomerase